MMHTYLRTIGFSELKNRAEVEKLLSKVVKEATERRILKKEDGTARAELSMEFAENIGITICGEYDEKNEFHIEHYFPYFRGKNISTIEELYVSKRVDTDAYTGMCDDYRLGVSLIFYLQNALDFLEHRSSYSGSYSGPITLSALALEGKVLLPVEKTEHQINNGKAEIKHRNQLITEARQGNQEAIDSLTIDDIDMYAMITKRIQKEDVYSIVDTTFIPYGSESDNYTVIGTIHSCRLMKNTETGEELYTLLIECNHICFEICINRNDILGEPIPGRRFKGIVWMQGKTDFLE